MTKSILFTRERAVSPNLKAELLSLSFNILEIPLIELTICPECIEQNVNQDEYDWLFFTSAAAVRFFYKTYGNISAHVKLAVIGSKTFSELKKCDQIRANYPVIFTSEVFVEDWLNNQTSKQNVLFPQSELSRGIIQKRLREEGHIVTPFTLYNNSFPELSKKELKKWLNRKLVGTIVVFASPSAWHNFNSIYKEDPFELQFASIGPVTSKVIESDGYVVAYEAPECTLNSLIKTITKK